MKTLLRTSSLFLLSVLLVGSLQAASIKVRSDRASGVYETGESINWTLSWQGPGEIPPPVVRYEVKLGGLTLTKSGTLDFSRYQASIDYVIDEPNSVILEVYWEENGEEMKAWGGAIADPEKIKLAAPAPDDFDAFWKEKITQLERIPMKAIVKPVNKRIEGVEYYKIWMDNIDDSRIQGQLALPTEGKNLPALLRVQWAGVYGLNSSWATDYAADGWLVLNILAHDLPIDEKDEFYRKQREGPLKDYYKIGADDRNKSYFLRMYLSCYRAVEYLKTRPEWDGKTIVVEGTSQGGQQTLVTAGMHPDITAAMALVPAGCDMLAPTAGRERTYPYWHYNTEGRDADAVHETSRYFDAANFAARIKCPLLVGLGLRDRTCPPAGIFAAVNQISTFKEIIILPESGHQDENGSQDAYQNRLKEVWLPALREGRPIAEAP
jgi:cephalosporin-C deacetylase